MLLTAWGFQRWWNLDGTGMSLLYRCLWTDASQSDRNGSVDLARDCFSRWATEDPATRRLLDGETVVGAKRIELRSMNSDGFYGFEGIVRETELSLGFLSTTWTVSARVLASSEKTMVWVDLDMETDQPARRVKIGRPGFVAEMLKLQGNPCLGVSNIVPRRMEITEQEIPLLVELLRSSERTLPFIIFSATQGDLDEVRQLEIANRTATRSTGVATVLTLDEAATNAFKQLLGPLAVWGGAARIYTPSALDTDADGWRHRYIVASKLRLHEGSAIDSLVYAASQLSTRRRVPDEFRVFTAGTRSGINSLELELREEQWQFELDLAYEERGEVEQELARANGHLERIRRELQQRDLIDLFFGTAQDLSDGADPPETTQSVSDAVAAAQLYLGEHLSVPSTAPRELEGIDSAPNAYAWGNTAWRGLRALAAYARAKSGGFSGNFWTWCERGDPRAWPASKKKLAMQESETVKNGKYASFRLFDIDPEVNGSNKVFMESHLKISEGGGDLAPRIYFYDDCDGHTKRVHVGFVGPHYLVPNTKG
ncbi:hypothetical protein ABZ436_29530 [Micromonospora matsumotoense]|uniref:hypothetical protein n=1 Tax=Micromonospora matsumotoense TaxID=121616 RepID=UPI0033E6736D